MPYPLGIDTKTVVGHYAEIYYDKILGQYLQRPKNGFVYVYPAVTEVLIDNTILDLSELSPQRIPVDTNGNFSVEVIVTDQDGLEPNNGWTYRFKPSWNESDSFISPTADLTSPIEMADYFEAEPVDGVITTRGNDGRGIVTITADGTIATVTYTDATTSTFDLPVGEGGEGGTATPDATSTTKGKLKLTNDLAGTADLPQVSAAIKASLAKADSAVQPAGLTKAAVGLGNVDNTSDLNKPVSNATQTALNLKMNISNLHAVATTGSYNDLNNKPTIPSTKADVGLENVDNTPDLNKPISTATQAALDGKSNIGHTHTIVNVTGLQAALDAKSDADHTHDEYVRSVNDTLPDANGNVVIATDVGSVDWSTITNRPDTFPPSTHTHVWADITDKPTTFTPESHNHSIANVTGLQAALDAKSDITHTHTWNNITDKPTTFTPASHNHAIADVTSLQTALDSKANVIHMHDDLYVGKNSLLLNVKDYGAVGNGVADDTAAIQATIDASINGVVYLPFGTYKVTSTLICPDAVKQKFTLTGASQEGTKIVYSGTGPFLTLDPNATPSTTTRRNYFHISNIHIVGPGNTNVGTIGLNINNALQGTISNVHVFNFETGVLFDGLNLVNGTATYYNNAFNLRVSGCITGFHFARQANSNILFGGRASHCATGIKIDASTTNITVDGTDIESNTVYGIDIAGYGNYFSGCRHENPSATAEVRFDDSTGESNGRKNTITGYWSSPDPTARIIWDAKKDNAIIWPGMVNYGDQISTTAGNVIRASRSAPADQKPFLDIEDTYSGSGSPIGIRYRERRLGRSIVVQRSPDGTNYYETFAVENLSSNANPRILLGKGMDATTPNQIQFGNNTPEGAVIGRIGDLFSRTNGGTGTVLYIKETGADTNTGWVPARTPITHTHTSADISDSTTVGKSILTAADAAAARTAIGLANVDNTSDINKPISTAVQAALDNKSDVSHTHSQYVRSVNDELPDENGNVVIATDVGSVDWTTITNKPTSFTPSAHNHVKADITDLTLPQYPNNSGIATVVPRQQTFNVRDYGALGDGSTNDTAAINTCIAAAPAGSRIFFPAGTYIVSPDATKHMLRLDKKNLEIFGANYNATVIKVANGAGDFISMITNRNPAGTELDTSGIFIHDLTFDQNVANNPVTDVPLLMSTNYRFSIRCTTNVQNGRVERVRFINSDCVINLVVTDGHNWQVRDCFFDNIGPGTDHDHSTVNIRGNNTHVTGCTFVGSGNAAWSAIEVHGDGHRVLFNSITNYARMIITCGAIVSGRDSIIAYNTGKGLGAGIHIWSYDFASLSGPSVEHLIIVNNQIEIDYDRWSSVFNNVRTGIELQPGSNSVIRDIKINDNQITYIPFSGTPTASDNRSAGILLYRGGDIVTEGTSDEDIDISNNQITGSISAGIYVDPYMNMNRLLIRGNNIVNPGSGAPNTAYRKGVFVAYPNSRPYTLKDAEISNNQVIDTRATHLALAAVDTSFVDTITNGRLFNNIIRCFDGANMPNYISDTNAPWTRLDITDWAEITNKPATFTPATHSHAAADITSGSITVARGGTGRATSTTAYGLIAAGTTATGAHQTIAPGTAGHFLKSAGAAALASFAAIDWTDIANKPATFTPAAHTHPSTDISDSTVTGRSVITAADAAAARTAIGAGTSNLAIGTTGTTAKVGNYVPDWAEITNKPTISGSNTGDQTITLTGEVTGSGTGSFAATVANAAVIGKVLTGYTSGAGTVVATDTILQAIQKLNGNDALKAPLASPTFTGTVSGITKAMVGLGNVDNTADTAKPVSTAQQAALNLKADLASPTFTGTPAAPTATAGTNTTQLATTAFVTGGLAGKSNTGHTHTIGDVTSLQTALDAKAPKATGVAGSGLPWQQELVVNSAALANGFNDVPGGVQLDRDIVLESIVFRIADPTAVIGGSGNLTITWSYGSMTSTSPTTITTTNIAAGQHDIWVVLGTPLSLSINNCLRASFSLGSTTIATPCHIQWRGYYA